MNRAGDGTLATSPSSRQQELSGATVVVFPSAQAACHHAADQMARIMREATAKRGRAVLGLATGGTPIPVYQRLVELTRSGELSWQQAATFNLDEYYPISPLDPSSYRHYMHEHLFQHVNLAANRAHLLDGTVPPEFAAEHCQAYDRWIEAGGGLDLQLLGIGRNGHIGFNEPCELPVDEMAALPSRLVELHPTTKQDARRDFNGDLQRVPRQALTMGVGPILSARAVLMLAFGTRKADMVAQSLLGPLSSAVPASLLRRISGRVTWLLDEEAAAGLPRETP